MSQQGFYIMLTYFPNVIIAYEIIHIIERILITQIFKIFWNNFKLIEKFQMLYK